MRILRVFFPFLFVRNWYSGEWELSASRLALFGAFLVLFCSAIAVIIVLNMPVEYHADV